jgi:hypothetical protein
LLNIHGIADMKRSRLLVNKPFLTVALLVLCQTSLLAQEDESTDSAAADPVPVATDPTPTAASESTDSAEADPVPAVSESTDSAATDPAPTAASEPTDSPAADPAPAASEPTDTADADPAQLATDPAPAASESTDSADADPAPVVAAVSVVSMADLLGMLKDQQSQLDHQKRQLSEQQQLIATLEVQATTELTAETEKIAKQAKRIEEQRQTMVSMQTQIDQINRKTAEELSESDIALRSRLETLESSIQASRDAADTAFDENSFPNSTMIPGTNAAMRMGGFVKMNIAETFDALGSLDRFIAGSIPVPQESSTARTTMTVGQSRLNWDLRDKTRLGTLRAYVEGDFAGSSDSTSDTFRLRHAFGQFKDILAGKTWSVFQDTDAAPEEIDFEGINGAVNVRQPQVRYFPKIGQEWDLMFSIEDPNPEVTGGVATSKWPDLVASARRTWFDRWHIKSSLVLRQITAICDCDEAGDTEQRTTGWGVSLSGKTATHFWNSSGQDNMMFQLNFGEGIGRYINDLNTVGGEDAKFDENGNLETLPVVAGYIAYQHWWRENARSTINLSWVDVDNLDFESDDAYHKTFRGALNYIWSPTSRIDIGAEVIFGSRENKDKDRATATQLQISSKYRF